uniref:Calponin-homology (CH) domain-containing protein n=1 Tax=Anisakis simplex TaxID=6269 RepID=A0A0M3KJP7_ANISI
LKKFETLHHQDLWAWIIDKSKEGIDKGKELRFLSISDEANIFAILLAEQLPNSKMTCAIRNELPKIDLPTNVTVVNYKTVDELLAVSFYVIFLRMLSAAFSFICSLKFYG